MERDNILLITTDQQRFDTIQALGNRQIFTPHLNYMASEGITFLNCYADCPVCVPSRTTIMTGKRGYESGIIGNMVHLTLMETMTKKRQTLPAILTDNGYQTKAMGKMHFDPPRAHYGFENMELPLDYMRHYDSCDTHLRPKRHGIGECLSEPVISTVPPQDSITAWTVEQSIDFLETRDPLRPFFMWTSFTKPHPPFDPCGDYWNLYDNMDFDLPVYGDWSQSLEDTPQGFLAGTYENSNMHLHSPEQLKAVKRAYYALITHVDYSLGRLFASLRENSLLRNTWIIFTSDHGEMLGDHHAAQKNLYFEGSAHVPLIIVPPADCKDYPRNSKVEHLAQLGDIYPTILTMAGIDYSHLELSGENLLTLNKDRTFYGSCIDTHFCLMKDKIKLVYCRRGGHYLLFDLNRDPYEQHNLTGDVSYTEVLEQMKKDLFTFVKETSPHVISGGDYITTKAPAYPGDSDGHWYGFHLKDYGVDVFH